MDPALAPSFGRERLFADLESQKLHVYACLSIDPPVSYTYFSAHAFDLPRKKYGYFFSVAKK